MLPLNALKKSTEFVNVITEEMKSSRTLPEDPDLPSDFEQFREQLRSLLWDDVTTQIRRRPGTWVQTLNLVSNEELWVIPILFSVTKHV